ncbi:RHS repeat-associated core domain-containing protein [Algimonas porphyrae]|uniref:Uncharacterized protein n=1 Tax=Algimonas porphyrae TaxID=1128113 RepID=A0ABQ5V3V1_9PROT|nr:RHS repeat-associated core domain-containing protein [Algimonas porphyrae]GLQ21350.1 hypothetical protein GCM10007854_23050 [Algimonas porphyrae]
MERVSLEGGHPLAKLTGSTLTYLDADHLGTVLRGTHGLGGLNGEVTGDEVFADFATPYGLNPTPSWWGDSASGFVLATGPGANLGSNCGVTGFTSHVRDCESGLHYMQARHYSPVSARFLSVDPVGFLDDGHPAWSTAMPTR